MELLHHLLHLDQFLNVWMTQYGTGIYVLLFLILFCETGFVVTPFLPGDSLLFALGALTSLNEGGLDFTTLSVLLVLAAFLGDNVNYSIGRFLGLKILEGPDRPWLKKSSIFKTQEFMDKNGQWAIVMARFAPFIRTFAPFVAGIGKMPRKNFWAFSLFGAVLWTQIFLWIGRLFGQTPYVKEHFSMLVLAVILISVIPLMIAFIKVQRRK